MLAKVKRKLSTKERMELNLRKALKRASKGKMPQKEREFLAKRTVERLDLDNPFQMQRSLESYADALVYDFFRKKRTGVVK